MQQSTLYDILIYKMTSGEQRGRLTVKKQELYQFLRSKDIVFEITEHKAVYNMAEVAEIGTPHPGAGMRKIFLYATIKSIIII